jgi:hypothetical protein
VCARTSSIKTGKAVLTSHERLLGFGNILESSFLLEVFGKRRMRGRVVPYPKEAAEST